MMRKRFYFLCVIFSGCITSKNEFKAVARKDINFMRDTILKNHPGVYNQDDPAFNDLVKEAYDKSIELSVAINSYDSYKNVLNEFVKRFNDIHVNLRFVGERKLLKSSKKKCGTFSIDSLGKNSNLITIPTFSPSSEQQKVIAEIIQKLPSLRNKKYIVFDITCSCGGNAQWGTKILKGLFSKKYVEEKLNCERQNISVDWRVTPGNINFLVDYLDKEKEQSEWVEKGQEKKIAALIKKMKDALEMGKKFYNEKLYKSKKCKTDLKSPARATIIVLISSSNVSASLDFLDEIKVLDPHVIFVGQETGSDTVYMDMRFIKLPSGNAFFYFPMKVYRGRKRGNHESYKPAIYFKDNIEKLPFNF